MSNQTLARHESSLNAREQRRLDSLADYRLGDVGEAAELGKKLAEHAADASDRTSTQFAAVNIIGDGYQQTIAGTEGVDLRVIARDQGICGRILYATGADDVFVTGDASLDPDLWDHPAVSGAHQVRFYAGAALIGKEGLPLGMLCVFATEPVSDLEAERAGARLVPVRDAIVTLLEERRTAGQLLSGQTMWDGQLSAELVQLVAPSRGAAIDAVIDRESVRTLFQPIVHLETGTIAAFEALSRGPVGTELESPLALLDAARAVGRLGELDWVCRANAMRAVASSQLPSGLSWFINVEPAGLEIQCPEHLRPAVDQARGGLRVVLEVVERGVEDNVTRLLDATDQARRDAWGVALDDVGAQAGSLALLPLLQPDVVKLDMSLLREAPSATAGDITAAVRAYAERTGAVILAEGIETPEQAAIAKIFGATYGQGYLYGHPEPLPSSVPAPIRPIPLRQRPAPIQGATPFEVLEAGIQAQRGRTDHLRHIFDYLLCSCERAQAGAVLLGLSGNRARYLANQDRLDAVATRNALTVCLVPDLPLQPENPRHHVGPLPTDSRLVDERAMIVLTPHFTGTLVLRHTGQTDSDGTPLVDFIYTHDRNATIAAARAYLDHMKPGTVSYPDISQAVMDNQHTEQRRRVRVGAYLSERLRPAPQQALHSASSAGNVFSNNVRAALPQAN